LTEESVNQIAEEKQHQIREGLHSTEDLKHSCAEFVSR